jgi:hypothetical protein
MLLLCVHRDDSIYLRPEPYINGSPSIVLAKWHPILHVVHYFWPGSIEEKGAIGDASQGLCLSKFMASACFTNVCLCFSVSGTLSNVRSQPLHSTPPPTHTHTHNSPLAPLLTLLQHISNDLIYRPINCHGIRQCVWARAPGPLALCMKTQAQRLALYGFLPRKKKRSQPLCCKHIDNKAHRSDRIPYVANNIFIVLITLVTSLQYNSNKAPWGFVLNG